MAAAQRISVRWGSGKRSSSLKSKVMPHVTEAVAEAWDVGESYGIVASTPKVCEVHVKGSAHDLGQTINDRLIRLFVPRSVRMFDIMCGGVFTVVSLHELAHAIRAERYDIVTMAEHAATEGVAHYAHDRFAQEVGLEYETVLNSPHNAPKLGSPVLRGFMNVRHKGEEELTAHNDYERWAVAHVGDSHFSVLEVIGIRAVQLLVAEGATLKELIHMPTDSIINERTVVR